MRPSLGVAIVAMLAGLMTAKVGRASASRVVVLHDPSSGAAVRRAEVRLEAELRASGFHVEEGWFNTDDDAQTVVETHDDTAPFATVLLRHRGVGTTTDVWVADRVTHKTVTRHFESRGAGESADRALALGVVELMRASLVEGLVLTPPIEEPSPAVLPPDVVSFTREGIHEPARFIQSQSLGLSVGVAAAFAGPEFGFAAGPHVRAAWRVSRALAIGLVAVGPTFGTRIVRSEGTASVRQELALLEATLEPAVRGRLSTYVALGAGAYHLDIAGDASPSYVSGHADAWAALCAAGGGVRARLSGDVSIAIDLRALAALPGPVLVFGADRIASAMRPGALGAFALAVNLE